MKKHTIKKPKPLAEVKEKYHQEIIVKPARRLLDALLEAEKKEVSTLLKTHKSATSSR